jgi:hypothetical protein
MKLIKDLDLTDAPDKEMAVDYINKLQSQHQQQISEILRVEE